MKKIKNKGFFLLETLIVTTIVALSMIFLYTQIIKLIDGYELRLTYNTVNGIYSSVELNKYIISDEDMYLSLINSPEIESEKYKEIICEEFTSSEYCNLIFTTLNINKVIVTKYNPADIKSVASNYEQFSEDLRLFITNIKNENEESTDYRIIVEFNNGEFATLKFNSGLDTIPPVITGEEILYIYPGEIHDPKEGLIATDNIYGDISSNIKCNLISGSTYQCNVKDSSGNMSENFTRNIQEN